MTKWQIFTNVFHVFCLCITVGLVGFWTYKFFLNEDRSVIEYNNFDDEAGNPYPLMTLCFRNPFVNDDKSHLNQSDKDHLESYLSGTEGVEKPRFDYNKVALNFTDYIKKYYIRWRNGTDKYVLPSDHKWDSVHHGFNGFWMNRFFRCFSVEAPNKDATVISMQVHHDLHPQGTRPSLWNFFVMFHYPNQVLRTSLFFKYMWASGRIKNGSTYEMVFTVENVEVFRRRKNCNQNWLDYDEKVMDFFVKKIGCRPPYFLPRNDDVAICDTSSQLKEMASSVFLSSNHGIDPPCKSLEFMTFKYDEIDYEGTVYDTVDDFWVSLVVPNLIFKVIYEHKNLAIHILQIIRYDF